MKKHIILISNLICGSIILGKFGVYDAIIMFILVGQIPGTTSSFSPTMMLAFFSAVTVSAIALSIFRLNRRKTIQPTLPKRRYSNI